MTNMKQWTTKDGSKIRIKDMENDHLVNTINFLEKRAMQMAEAELRACANISFSGEEAQRMQDDFLENTPEDIVENYLPDIFEDLIEEASKRDLELQ